jgi:hypothetical protein
MSARLLFGLEVTGDNGRFPRLGSLDRKRPVSLADDAVVGFHEPQLWHTDASFQKGT